MTNEEDATTIKTFSNLLSAIGINTIIYIDDQFSGANHKEADFLAALNNVPEIIDLKTILDIVDDDIDNKEIIVEMGRNYWEDHPERRQELYVKLMAAVDGDIPVSSALENLINAQKPTIDGKLIPPEVWDTEKVAILSNATRENKVLCLFDLDLHHSPGYTSEGDKSGLGLLKEALETKPASTDLIFGIFTGKISREREYEYWRTCGDDALMGLKDRFLPLSKARTLNMDEFIDGIKKLSIHPYIQSMRSSGIELITESHNRAIEQLNEFDTYTFERMVIKAAYKSREGIWEVDTILRLYNIYLKDTLKEKILTPKYAENFNDAIHSIRPISGSTPLNRGGT